MTYRKEEIAVTSIIAHSRCHVQGPRHPSFVRCVNARLFGVRRSDASVTAAVRRGIDALGPARPVVVEGEDDDGDAGSCD